MTEAEYDSSKNTFSTIDVRDSRRSSYSRLFCQRFSLVAEIKVTQSKNR
jgi:hypothetical protein